ncbi:ABC transporter permease [Anaerovorax odorimutans]|uniref:ABC transporter permease n=1 Tax=Anaerovorax odorimutans TaxID=109327 RepID=A0ABT1RSS3_9FIRM|nr:ABC transporter permease [Anaerovorax odorimutans]MCQ4638206.1 ABC transporter permease [Anaerovorax odorimutans]
MIAFTKRNLYVFFRDRSAVFFSLLASLIIVGLYVLFLGDTWASNFEGLENVKQLMDNWVMAGLLSVTSVTTTLGAFGIMVGDRAQKISKDFYVSPMRRRDLAGGYVLSAAIVGFILSIITLIAAEIYIAARGGELLGLPALFKLLLLILAADLANTAMIFFITSFFESNNAFSTASTIIGTLIGFITGIYLPIGILPDGVQWLVRLFPTSHAAALMRQTMMAAPMAESLAGASDAHAADFKEMLGIHFWFGDYEISALLSLLILLCFGALFFVLAAVNLSRRKRV